MFPKTSSRLVGVLAPKHRHVLRISFSFAFAFAFHPLLPAPLRNIQICTIHRNHTGVTAEKKTDRIKATAKQPISPASQKNKGKGKKPWLALASKSPERRCTRGLNHLEGSAKIFRFRLCLCQRFHGGLDPDSNGHGLDPRLLDLSYGEQTSKKKPVISKRDCFGKMSPKKEMRLCDSELILDGQDDEWQHRAALHHS